MKKILLPFFALLLIGAGCKTNATPQPAAAPTNRAPAETNGIKYNPNPLSVIPADFPKDIPYYPGGKIITAMTVANISTLAQDTKAKPADVIAWATKQFASMNVNKINEIDMDRGGKTFDFEKDGAIFRVRIDVAADGIALLTVVKEKK